MYSSTKQSTEFPTPFVVGDYGDGAEPKSRLEQLIVQVSSSIRLKPQWQTKINNKDIVNKWELEARDQGVTEHQFQFVMDELHYFASLSEGKIRISPVDGVWEADHLIDTNIRQKLLDGVAKLENVPESQKDWHPGSNHQVLDLVHPSLYCFVNGVTRITKTPIPLASTLKSMDKGSALQLILVPPPLAEGFHIINGKVERITGYTNRRSEEDYSLSKKYQWLPSEFRINNDGTVAIESYINNLHPVQHAELYGVIEKIFAAFVPMFNKVLTDLINLQNKKNRITIDSDWYESLEDYKRKNPSETTLDNSEDEEDYYEEDYYDNRDIIIPDVKQFTPPSVKTVIDLKGKQLQVIVKLANIELTPDNPNYPGGSWHVEGMKNENIVASGIYYYYSQNITESQLEFREAIKEPDYEQNDNRGVETVYGLVDDGALNQKIGYVITQEDRCIAFPNIYQHRVKPFSLINKSEPGYRKILVFFLVDPNHRVLSTANVPPQQSSWADPSDAYEHNLMELSQAIKYREDLMKERKFFIKENTEQFFERPFSLCEH